MQRALRAPGGLERFLPWEEAAHLRAVMPEQWHLGEPRELEEARAPVAAEPHIPNPTRTPDPNPNPLSSKARALIEAEPEGYVAKNLLRPRTGSNATRTPTRRLEPSTAAAPHVSGVPRVVTEDRLGTGGAIVAEPAPLRALLRDEARRAHYLLYRKLRPATHEAEVHTPAGETLRLGGGSAVDRDGAMGGGGGGGAVDCGGGGGGAATSEVATFGVFLAANGGGEVLRNEAAGVGARTRPADPGHPLAAELGYGALSCVQLRGAEASTAVAQ